MRILLLIFLALGLSACGDTEEQPPDNGGDNGGDDWIGGTCEALFGRPTENSGLTDAQCQPSCDCDGQDFVEEDYGAADFDALREMVLLTDLETLKPLTYDPYEDVDQYDGAPTTEVCGLRYDTDVENGYHLQTYADDAEAQADGALVTHYGNCGLCSGMQDLLVYIENPDLTGPVRQCGVDGMLGGEDGEEIQRQCLRDIGFSEPCLDIWYYNTEHTKSVCLSQCITRIQAPHHMPNGALNPCIQCDEDRSGNVFKDIAGRTRRNSGLATALCRPCNEVAPIDHRYEAP